MKMTYKYKTEKKLEERKKESEKIISYFPDKIPIICEKDPKCNLTELEKSGYIIKKNMSVNKFIAIFRKKIKIEEGYAFYLLVNQKYILLGNNTMSEIYDKFKDKEDGFLYITYSSELMWGKE